MSFPAYSNYRDSGVAWIGSIPADWNVMPLLAVADECDQSNKGMVEDNLLSLSYGSIVRKDITTSDGLLPESFETYQVIERDDVIWRLTDLQNDKRSLRTAIATERGIITSAYLATRPDGILPAFLCYLLRAYDHQKVFYSMGGGLRQSMKFADVRRMPILIPSASEQTAIAAFLDRETAKIDALVDEQRRLIELLKEKRQAVISHAVTKGLDPTVPMKDSGVEWLGDVPAHWEVVPIKRVTNLVTSGPRGWSELASDEGEVFFQSQNIGRQMEYILTDAKRINVPAGPDADRAKLVSGDVVVCITGGRTGAVAAVRGLAETCYINQHVCLLRPVVTEADGVFLAYVLFGRVGQEQLALSMYGLKQGLGLEDVKNVLIGLPPLAEQCEVVAMLDRLTEQMDKLVVEAECAIAFLSERRSALISAAVTGKIDVRPSAKVLSFSIGRARARALIATEIIERLAHQSNFGRVKLQKIAFLAEAYVGVSELAGAYIREAAGPLDRIMVDEMESGAHIIAGVTVDQAGGAGTAVSYQLHRQRGSSRQELADWLGVARIAKLDKLIADLADLSTTGSEAVATLYAVWNDAVIAGATPTDNDIISDFLNNWHPEKRQKFRADELPRWLEWMRRHDIVPSGSGPTTTVGSLFS